MKTIKEEIDIFNHKEMGRGQSSRARCASRRKVGGPAEPCGKILKGFE